MIRARRVWQSSPVAQRDRRESRAEDFSPEEESEPDLHGWLKEEPQDDWRRKGKEEPDLSPEEEEEKPDLSPEEEERPDLSPEEEESPHSRTRSEVTQRSEQTQTEDEAEEMRAMMEEMKRQNEELQAREKAFIKEQDDVIAQKNGQALCDAIKKDDRGTVDKLMRGTSMIDYGARGYAGMTPLHHAARALNKELVFDLVERAPNSADAITYTRSTPSHWSVLNCAADVGRPKSQPKVDEYVQIALKLVRAMCREALLNITGPGTTAVHQMASRGHHEALAAILPVMAKKTRRGELEALINRRVGRDGVGAVDTALRSCKAAVAILKKFKGLEQTSAPDDWRSGRRRERDVVSNWLSDNRKSRRAGWGQDGSWQSGPWQGDDASRASSSWQRSTR